MRLGTVDGAARRRWRAALLGLALLTPAGCEGCEGEAERKVRLIITSQAQIPSQFDRVVVHVVAARRDDPTVASSYRTCEPEVGEFVLTSSGRLPIYIDYYPGPLYYFWVAFRVEFFRGSVLVSTDEWMASLGDSGASERTVTLDAACAGMVTPCPAGQKCVDQNCVDPGGAGAFDHPELIDTGTPCSPLGGPPDGASW